MFQTFDVETHSADAAARVRSLRVLMSKAALDAFLVPRADEFQGEYVPPSAERLKWLTGFSGSAGCAAIANRAAALFVDGRYTVQVQAETDAALFAYPGFARTHLAGWLLETLRKGAVVGFDPWLHTAGEIERLQGELKPKGLRLKPVSKNLVDRVWGKDRPKPPTGAVRLHPVKLAGTSAADKIVDLQKRLKGQGQDAVVLTLPDSVA